MATQPRQIFPNDLRPNIALGIDLPLNGPAVFNSTYQTKDAIKANLINFLLTNPGERVGNPTFGAGLRAFLFNQIETGNLNDLEDVIQEGITSQIPNINLQSVRVGANEEYNTVSIQISYSVANTGIEDTLDVTFN